MHGGAPGSGAPRGNKNALKHGRYTREALAEYRRVRDLIRIAGFRVPRISLGCCGAAGLFGKHRGAPDLFRGFWRD